MIKKLGFIVVGALVLNGCGGTSSGDTTTYLNTDTVKSKTFIAIITNMSKYTCTDTFASTISVPELENATDLVVGEVASGTNCATYGRINEDGTCSEQDAGVTESLLSPITCVASGNKAE